MKDFLPIVQTGALTLDENCKVNELHHAMIA
jgi:hypothetical protein